MISRKLEVTSVLFRKNPGEMVDRESNKLAYIFLSFFPFFDLHFTQTFLFLIRFS